MSPGTISHIVFTAESWTPEIPLWEGQSLFPLAVLIHNEMKEVSLQKWGLPLTSCPSLRDTYSTDSHSKNRPLFHTKPRAENARFLPPSYRLLGTSTEFPLAFFVQAFFPLINFFPGAFLVGRWGEKITTDPWDCWARKSLPSGGLSEEGRADVWPEMNWVWGKSLRCLGHLLLAGGTS